MRPLYLSAKTQYVLMLEVVLEQILLYSSYETKGYHKERLLRLYKKIEFCNSKLYR